MKGSFEEPELTTVTTALLSQETTNLAPVKLGSPKLDRYYYSEKFQSGDVLCGANDVVRKLASKTFARQVATPAVMHLL